MQDKSYVRDDAQHVVPVFPVQVYGIFVVRGQEDFRSGALPEFALFLVQRFFQKFGALLQYELVEFRQVCGIIADRVFHQQYGLYTDFQNVVVGVDQILEQFHYRHYQLRIAVPAEYIVHAGTVLLFKSSVDFP